MIKSILLAMALILPSLVHAARCSGDVDVGGATTVVFVNGIMNDEQASCSGSNKLRTSVSLSGVDLSRYNSTHFYNPTDGALDDVHELRFQAAVSSAAMSLGGNPNYYTKLGQLYAGYIEHPELCLSYVTAYRDTTLAQAVDILTDDVAACSRVRRTTSRLIQFIKAIVTDEGRNVVLVPHSQGNFYVEAAYAYLREKGYEYLDRIRVFGVAAIAQRPIGGKYLTISQDAALFVAQKFNVDLIANKNYDPAPATGAACVDGVAGYLLCVDSEGGGSSQDALGAITGSMNFANYLGYLPGSWQTYINTNYRGNQKFLLHEFAEVYLNNNLKTTLPDGRVGKLPTIIALGISEQLRYFESQQFSETFSSTVIDSTKWTNNGYTDFGGNPPVGVSTIDANGVAQFPAWAALNTKGKVTFTGSKIVVEARMGGVESRFMLADGPNPGQSVIMISNTPYCGWGMNIQARGPYKPAGANGGCGADIPVPAAGGYTSAMREYRLTIDGTSLLVESGPTLANITQTLTTTLGTSITGKSFFLTVGTGATAYSPGSMDWIRVSVDQAAVRGILNTANGHRYEMLQCGNWTQCRDAAQLRGGKLATIRSAAENQWIIDNITSQYSNNTYKAAFIGLYRDPANFNNWLWLSGEPVIYTHWEAGEPNNAGGTGETVGMIFSNIPPPHNRTDPGIWNDTIPNMTQLWDGSAMNQAVVEYQ